MATTSNTLSKAEERAADFVTALVFPLALIALAYGIYRYHMRR